MTEARGKLEQRVLELRLEFDRRFADPAATETVETVKMLAIRVGEQPYAVALRELVGVYLDRPIVPVPSHVPELSGLCAVRGATMPVYDLAALLGHTAALTPRWLLLPDGADSVALAFDHFDGHLSVTQTQIAPARQAAAYCHAVCMADVVRPIIHLASVLEAIARRTQPPKEP